MCINLHFCRCKLPLFDGGLFECGLLSEYLNKTDTGSFIVQGEMILSLSSAMSLGKMFDLEWLDNLP